MDVVQMIKEKAKKDFLAMSMEERTRWQNYIFAAMGANGWELVTVTNNPIWAYFKREK